MTHRNGLTYGNFSQEEALTFTANFPAVLLAQAEKVRQQRVSPQAAYLNALAAYAVSFYCDCIDVKTNLPVRSSWNPTLSALMETAELITEKGKLECCSILPGSEVCYIPPKVSAEALGCVVVEVDIDRNQAKLLGFTSAVSEGELPISRLLPLAALIDRLIGVAEAPTLSLALTRLNQWFDNVFDDEWQSPKTVLAMPFRGRSEAHAIELGTAQYRAKTLTIGSYQLALVVQIDRIDDGLDILLSVHPSLNYVLPVGLRLELLSDRAEVTMSMTASENDNYLSLTFQIDSGEAFGVRLTVADRSAIEQFIS